MTVTLRIHDDAGDVSAVVTDDDSVCLLRADLVATERGSTTTVTLT